MIGEEATVVVQGANELQIASCGLLFTAQPKAPASAKAGAFGWAVNNKINSLLIPVDNGLCTTSTVPSRPLRPRAEGEKVW